VPEWLDLKGTTTSSIAEAASSVPASRSARISMPSANRALENKKRSERRRAVFVLTLASAYQTPIVTSTFENSRAGFPALREPPTALVRSLAYVEDIEQIIESFLTKTP